MIKVIFLGNFLYCQFRFIERVILSFNLKNVFCKFLPKQKLNIVDMNTEFLVKDPKAKTIKIYYALVCRHYIYTMYYCIDKLNDKF